MTYDIITQTTLVEQYRKQGEIAHQWVDHGGPNAIGGRTECIQCELKRHRA